MTHCSVRGAAFEKGVKGAAIRLEIEKCENCGGKMKIIAGIEDPNVIEKILKHLGLDEASGLTGQESPEGLFAHSTQLL